MTLTRSPFFRFSKSYFTQAMLVDPAPLPPMAATHCILPHWQLVMMKLPPLVGVQMQAGGAAAAGSLLTGGASDAVPACAFGRAVQRVRKRVVVASHLGRVFMVISCKAKGMGDTTMAPYRIRKGVGLLCYSAWNNTA